MMQVTFQWRVVLLLCAIAANPCLGEDGPDPLHISESAGPKGLAVIKPVLTGQDIESTEVEAGSGPMQPDAPVKASAPRNISLNHGNPAAGIDTGMIVNPQGKFALMAYWSQIGKDPLSIQRVDLARSDCDKVIPLDLNLQALGISPDGKRMITRSDKPFYPLTRWRMDVWSLEASPPKPLLSFRAYDAAGNGADTIIWASYLDPTHVLSSSASHTLTLWEITDTTAKEIYTMQGDGTVSPQLSSGLKYVIVGMQGSILVREAMTGKCVAKCTAFTDGGDLAVCLRSDAQRLALAGHQRLVICDLPGDKVLLDVGLPAKATGVSVAWIDPHLVLIDNSFLFDIDHHSVVWQYEVTEGVPLGQWMGDRLAFQMVSGAAFVGGPGKCSLNSFSIPDDKIKQLLKHPRDGEFLVKPGTQVSLEVNGIDGEFRTKVIEKLTQRLTDAGVTVADGQPIKLVAESKAVDQHDVTYRTNGRNAQNQAVTIADTIQSIAFMMDGKPLWQTDSVTLGSAPMFVFRTKGQSIADAVNEQNKPKMEWFLQTGIPRTILKPAEPQGSSPFGQVGGRMRNGR